jgi:hypothetical protein
MTLFTATLVLIFTITLTCALLRKKLAAATARRRANPALARAKPVTTTVAPAANFFDSAMSERFEGTFKTLALAAKPAVTAPGLAGNAKETAVGDEVEIVTLPGATSVTTTMHVPAEVATNVWPLILHPFAVPLVTL